MIVCTLEMDLRIEGARSLKDKRQAIRGLLERTRRDFGISIAEVGDLNLWGNATIGAACVSSNAVQAESVLRAVLERFDTQPQLTVDQFSIEVLRTE